jgi:hypothetical protein
MAVVTTFCDFFGCSGGGPAPSPGSGTVPNLLSVDYQGDWLYLDGIEDLTFAFGPQRYTTQTASGTVAKAKRSALTDREVAVAASTFGYEPDDMTFVVWAETLVDTTNTIIEPEPGDKFTAFDSDWIIKSKKRNADLSQWRCTVRKSTKE